MTLTLTPKESEKLLARYQDNPEYFIEEVLGYKPWDTQLEIMNSVRKNPRTAVRSCSGSGKTRAAASTLLWFLYSFPPSTVISTAPTQRQVKDILWKEVQGLYYGAKIPFGGKLLTTELNLDEEQKWFAVGLTTKEQERFLGYHNKYILVIADEASGIPEEIYDAIENPLSSGFARLLLIGNPTQRGGTFHRAFDEDNTRYEKFHISYKDTPNFRDDIPDIPALISPEWVDDRRKEWGEGTPLWQVYVMGEFSTEDTGALIPLQWIEEARSRDLSPAGPIILGADTAAEGDDENVAIVRQGPKMLYMEAWHSADIMETANKIKAIADNFYVNRINVDKAPIGLGVINRLQEQDYNCYGVRVGDPAEYHPGQFLNIRAEGYWNLRELFQNGTIDIWDDKELMNQVSQVHYDTRPGEQRIKIEAKKDMKKRTGLSSPDRADALMLAFYDFTGKIKSVMKGGIPCRQY
jgi:phage terminase large subunit